MIEIKHRITGKILYTHNGANLAEADLCGANLADADLRGAYLADANLCDADLRHANLAEADLCGAYLADANLRGAYLVGAYLRGANLADADLRGAYLADATLRGAYLADVGLWGTIGDGTVIRTAQFERYTVTICDDWVQIGCQGHRYHEWEAFDDETIANMDAPHSLSWWRKHKALILAFADVNYQKEE